MKKSGIHATFHRHLQVHWWLFRCTWCDHSSNKKSQSTVPKGLWQSKGNLSCIKFIYFPHLESTSLSRDTSCLSKAQLGASCFVQEQCPEHAGCYRGNRERGSLMNALHIFAQILQAIVCVDVVTKWWHRTSVFRCKCRQRKGLKLCQVS